MDDRKNLGYVQTPEAIGLRMLALKRNNGTVLDPASGMGLWRHWLPGIVGLELSPDRTGPGVINTDFFAYPEGIKYDTIICNPPYVRGKNITPDTRALFQASVLPHSADLYLRYIEKMVKHLAPGGELIAINPRGFAKDTTAAQLNTWLLTQGAITHWEDLGGQRVFPDATPDCVIWRFEKGATDGVLTARNGLLLPVGAPATTVGDFASVRVGAVSGADRLFEHPTGTPHVCSETREHGYLRPLLPDDPAGPHRALLAHKSALTARRIARFDESNWWRWGRAVAPVAGPRLYVNCKTRSAAPFFYHDCPNYDGSVLALHPKPGVAIEVLCRALNANDWAGLGYVSGGRHIFTQRSLQYAPLDL